MIVGRVVILREQEPFADGEGRCGINLEFTLFEVEQLLFARQLRHIHR